MAAPLMPKATAVWLIDNTTLTFRQIAKFCEIHELEIQTIADGDIAANIQGVSPVNNGQLSWEEIHRCEADASANLVPNKLENDVREHNAKAKKVLSPTQRSEKQGAILWVMVNYPEVADKEIRRLLQTTDSTIKKIREGVAAKDPAFADLKPKNAIHLGFFTERDLEEARQNSVKKSAAKKSAKKKVAKKKATAKAKSAAKKATAKKTTAKAKPAAKKATAKKTTAKAKPAAKKATAKKATAKKATAKAKPAAKKATAKKTTAKAKPAAKKATAKKTTAKAKPAAKKATAKKTTAKAKPAAKKATAKKTTAKAKPAAKKTTAKKTTAKAKPATKKTTAKKVATKKSAKK